MFENSTILITGGTGSFGRAFTSMTFSKYNPRKIIIFSRDEMKQWDMQQDYLNEDRIRFLLGDVRDKERVYRAFKDVDYVIHAAANKIVPLAEKDPFECIKTNIDGAKNIINAAIDNQVKRIIALSTDKASSPANLYGATKMVSDNLFINANRYAGKQDSLFSVVRYGNVMGSRGSIIPLFFKLSQNEKNYLPITDPEMTRFMITLEQGVKYVWKSIENMKGGEIFIKKLPSMNILEIARVVAPNLKHKIIGIRPGEKMHEQMISTDDALNTYEEDDQYIILPTFTDKYILKGKKVGKGFSYKSDTNSEWMASDQLSDWLNKNKNRFDRI